jgi:hypothetical protein
VYRSIPKPPRRVQQSECVVAGHDVALAFAALWSNFTAPEIDALVHRGLLRAGERDDEGAVIESLSQYIEQTLGSPL